MRLPTPDRDQHLRDRPNHRPPRTAPPLTGPPVSCDTPRSARTSRTGCSFHDIRTAELAGLRDLIPTGSSVLELGGAQGAHAAQLSSWGCRVLSIDLPGRDKTSEQAFPVQDYDGRSIPARNGEFDVVFSSNVLEHVVELPPLLCEVRRVLRRDGRAIHLMPTPAWRFWTSVTHYASIAQFVFGRATGRQPQMLGYFEGPAPLLVLQQRGVWHAVKRASLPGAHGQYKSSLHELFRYSRLAWSRVFRSAGFAIETIRGNGIFYAGYGLLPSLTLRQRRVLARILGSACHAYVTTPARVHLPEHLND
jgi:SAM-dependent methyltransferase